MLLVVIIGLAAAFLFAASAALQQRAAKIATAEPTSAPEGETNGVVRALPILRVVRNLTHNRLWLFGWITNLVGFFTQAAALHLGSVALVQPLLVTQLLFALPLASVGSRCWPSTRDWLSGLAISGGVAVFLAVRGAAPLEGDPDRWKVILAGVSTAGLVVLLVIGAMGRPPFFHTTMIAVAAGLCFAMSAVLMKLTADDLIHRGVAETALDWPGYCLALSTLTGLLLEQEAFATGSLAAAVAAMTITNPMASYLIGVLAFDVTPPSSPGALAAVAASGLLLFVGAVGLANAAGVGRPSGEVSTPGERPAPATTSRPDPCAGHA